MWPRVLWSGEGSWLEWNLDLGGTRIGNNIKLILSWCTLTFNTQCGNYRIWCCVCTWLNSWMLSVDTLGLSRLLDILNWNNTLLEWQLFDYLSIFWWGWFGRCYRNGGSIYIYDWKPEKLTNLCSKTLTFNCTLYSGWNYQQNLLSH